MNTFKGEINGVTYTSRKEFLNSLRKMKNEDVKDVQIFSQSESCEGKECNCECECACDCGCDKNCGTAQQENQPQTPENEVNINELMKIFFNQLCGIFPPITDNKEVEKGKPTETKSETTLLQEKLKQIAEADYQAMCDLYLVDIDRVNLPLGTHTSQSCEKIINDLNEYLKGKTAGFAQIKNANNIAVKRFMNTILKEIDDVVEIKNEYNVITEMKSVDEGIADRERIVELCKKYSYDVDDVENDLAFLHQRFDTLGDLWENKNYKYYTQYFSIVIAYYAELYNYLKTI